MKVVILAGGLGTRLATLIGSSNKHLLPIGSDFVITRGIKSLVASGLKDFLVITNKGSVDLFRSLFDSDSILSSALISIKTSSSPDLPLAEVLLEAIEYVDDGEFILLLGDNVFLESSVDLIKSLIAETGQNVLVLAQSKAIQQYGVPIFTSGLIKQIVEKPKGGAIPAPGQIVTGLTRYTKDVFKYIRLLKNQKSPHRDLTAVHNLMIKDDRITFTQWEGGWFDVGTIEGYANTIKYYEKHVSKLNDVPDVTKVSQVLKNSEVAHKIVEFYNVVIRDKSWRIN